MDNISLVIVDDHPMFLAGLQQLFKKQSDFEVIGVEQTDQSVQLNDFQLVGENPVALVFGNEVGGIDEAVLPLLDHCIEVPQWGTKHSINVAVCAGIVIWHLIFSGTTRHM